MDPSFLDVNPQWMLGGMAAFDQDSPFLFPLDFPKQDGPVIASRDMPSTTMPTAIPSDPIFTAPSHQYGEYRQETPMAPGALAGAIAMSAAMPWANLAAPQQSLSPVTPDDFDFSTSSFDASPLDGMPSSPLKRKRIYPGYHSQQQQQTQRQQQMQQQQQQQKQQQQQQQQQTQTQQRLPTPTMAQLEFQHLQQLQLNHVPQPSRTQKLLLAPSPQVTQLQEHFALQSFTAAASPSGDEGGANDGSQANGSRTQKSLEEMDEDERLLNSEEGKKLSSKERRQLRNKVSARHFRARRKSNTAQIQNNEDLIRQKNNDLDRIQTQYHHLKANYEELVAENQRQRTLVEFLLRSPEFAANVAKHPELFQFSQPLSLEQVVSSAPAPNLQTNTPLSYTGGGEMDALLNLNEFDEDEEDDVTDQPSRKRFKSQ
ncbi:hypothetical protein QBC39DRAFT_369048 [Podospora conica]|nr:hypothetical protein QBC39DRAFT_369048 [Schizothecium conicum]